MKEIKAYTVAVGNLSLMPWMWKSNNEFCRILKEDCEGFLGLNPQQPRGTLLIFKTENDAKRARNILRDKGVECGKNIGECFIPAEYAKEDE